MRLSIKWWVSLCFVVLLTAAGCASVPNSDGDTGDDGTTTGDNNSGGDDGGGSLTGFCANGGTTNLPSTLPGSFNGVQFTEVGTFTTGGLIDLEFLPGTNGHSLAITLDGRVFYLDETFAQIGPVQNIAVGTNFEQGLLNVAADPNYDGNASVYFYHTQPDESENRVTRYTVNVNVGMNTFSISDPQTIIRFPKNENPNFGNNHNGGGLLFDEVGNLIIGVGDGGGAGSANTELAISQNQALSLGKIHRIVPVATGVTNGGGQGDGFTLPVLPLDDLNDLNSEGPDSIYMSGFRNPFTIVGKEKNDQLAGDVGGDSYEELDCLYRAGENFGWPLFEGPEGLLAGFEPAAHGYCHNDNSFANEDPLAVDTNARSIMVLAFVEGMTQYGGDGMLFERRVIYSDFYQGWIRALRVESNHVKSGDDHIGHMPGMTSLQMHPSNGFYYGVSLTDSNQILRMELVP